YRGGTCQPHGRGILIVDVKKTGDVSPSGDRLEGRPLSIGRDVNRGIAVGDVRRRIKNDGKSTGAAEGALRTDTCSVAALALHAGVSAVADHSDPVDACAQHPIASLGAPLHARADASRAKRRDAGARQPDSIRAVALDGAAGAGIRYLKERSKIGPCLCARKRKIAISHGRSSFAVGGPSAGLSLVGCLVTTVGVHDRLLMGGDLPYCRDDYLDLVAA